MACIRAFLKARTQLWISPDGELTIVPFAAFQDEKKHYLVDRYTITYLGSGRDLVRFAAPGASGSEALVPANPDFGGRYSQLPGASVEADSIGRVLVGARILKGSAA